MCDLVGLKDVEQKLQPGRVSWSNSSCAQLSGAGARSAEVAAQRLVKRQRGVRSDTVANP